MDEHASADPGAVIVAGRARFTVLTPTLLRLEWTPDGVFEDRPSLFAVRRRFTVPPFEQRLDEQRLMIRTEVLTLNYRADDGPFAEGNLRIRIGGDPTVEWMPGTPNRGNLGGTVRTLDECKGCVDLPDGILSRDGWFLLDDSLRPLFDNGWVAPRVEGGRQDWYFFGYGRDYVRALKDLMSVGGPIPLPPRFALGSWYSRYWPYRAEEFIAIADEYARFGFPLDVMVMDMDWHLEGWTGYTWNRRLISYPVDLLSKLHERGLKVTLNLHPAGGVKVHEKAYSAFAKAMEVDPAKQEAIPFDCTDPVYMKNYFELLHHPLEEQGVDFWWIDWQQEAETRIPGLDPLFWLNHRHFQDLQRERPDSVARRGLTLSRWGGWGGHRYPIQFSGDTWATWEVLRFLVKFTTCAGNVGAAYWSHDLGGHFADGRTDPELFVRWLQFGAFSAAMRVHTTLSEENDRRPWLDGERFADAAREAFALRYQLLPYTYTMARKCHDTGLPLNRPMYLAHPHDDIAYVLSEQFFFGDDLIVAPVLRRGRGSSRVVDVDVWLPDGDWYELTSGHHGIGPAHHTVGAALDHVPVFVRGGRPIPMARLGRTRSDEALDELHVRVYPGRAGKTRFYEDDGESTAYLAGECAWTPLRYEAEASGCRVQIGPTTGTYKGIPEARRLQVELPVMPRPYAVHLNGKPASAQQWDYDMRSRTSVVRVSDVRPSDVCTFLVEFAHD